MFEGKSPRSGDASPPEAGARENAPLRPLKWSDLVDRLAAARDLRASLGAPAQGGSDGGDASFDAGSARRIAAHQKGKDGVYPDDLGNGKGTGGKELPAESGKGLPPKSGSGSPVRGTK